MLDSTDERFPAMGSEAHVIVVGDSALLSALLTLARRRIEDLERRWSRFLRDSEISALNGRRGQPVTVSPDTFRLVHDAVQAWRDTDGRFDPTVLGDMVRAGYDRPFQAVVVLKANGVSLLRRNCGAIRLDAQASSVTLPQDAGFDPGGIGKGLAADIVVEELLGAGAAGACVNLGGDLRVEGEAPGGGDDWVVDVAHPAHGPVAKLVLAAGAIATSTTMTRRWDVDGDPRHHLIDVATGRSRRVDRGGVVMVTALARHAAMAEVATKAALLAAPGLAPAALEELGCDGLVVHTDGEVACTSGLDRFVVARGDEDGAPVSEHRSEAEARSVRETRTVDR